MHPSFVCASFLYLVAFQELLYFACIDKLTLAACPASATGTVPLG